MGGLQGRHRPAERPRRRKVLLRLGRFHGARQHRQSQSAPAHKVHDVVQRRRNGALLGRLLCLPDVLRLDRVLRAQVRPGRAVPDSGLLADRLGLRRRVPRPCHRLGGLPSQLHALEDGHCRTAPHLAQQGRCARRRRRPCAKVRQRRLYRQGRQR
eukprot:Amastigsp_a178309_13.p3 type:complete len:156 gc:universal Amastigsp_a178309_13:505-38(-)